MELVRNTQIATKLIVLVAVMSLMIAAAAGYGMKMVNDINTLYQKTYDEDAYAATISEQIGKYFAENRNSLTRYLFTTDPQGRQQGPGKRPYVDDLLPVAKAVQGRGGLMQVAEFPIVVILQQIHPLQLGGHNQVIPFPFCQGPPLVGVGGRDGH